MRSRLSILAPGPLAACLLLVPACAVPGDAAWSDLHASAFGAAYVAGFESSGNDITVTDSSGAGLDFNGDLRLARETEVATYAGLRLGFAPIEFSLSQFGYDGSNNGQITNGTRFAGQPMSGSLDIGSELDLAVTKLMVGIDVINTPAARIALLVGLDYVEFNRFDLIAQETKTSGGGTVTSGDVQTLLEDQSAPVPMVGLRGDALVPFLGRVGAEVSGLKANFEDADILYLDFDVAAHWEPWHNIEFVLGYRAVVMNVEGDVDATHLDIDLDVNGPYVGLSVYW